MRPTAPPPAADRSTEPAVAATRVPAFVPAAADAIRRYADTTEAWTTERCHIAEMSNGLHDRALSIARALVEPGVTTRWHHLIGTVERYVIIEGRGRVEVGDQPAEIVGPGDVVLIGPMTRQRITNTGSTDLVFLALCTPRFERRNYVEHDEPA